MGKGSLLRRSLLNLYRLSEVFWTVLTKFISNQSSLQQIRKALCERLMVEFQVPWAG